MENSLTDLAEKLRVMNFDSIPVQRTAAGEPHQLDWPENQRPDFGGVYAFWWKRGRDHLLATIQNRTIAFHGPGGVNSKEILLHLTPSHFSEVDGRVPLYIGKTHGGETSCIARRVGMHLILQTKRAVPVNSGSTRAHRKTTSCQVRDRLDRLLDRELDPRSLILDNLALSFVRVDDWVTRFFLEDLAIGRFQPLFNLDCER
jgi:hypothetical protein